MFSYENGLFLAFLLWVFQEINLLISINSQLEKNLNRIGARLSWSSLSVKDMDEDDINKSAGSKIIKFLLLAAFGFAGIFLSWITIIFFVLWFIYKLQKSYGEPKLNRELRWKMKNIDMPRDQILLEIFKTMERPKEEFEKYKEDYINSMRERGVLQ